jgi:hypothetical protein
MSQETLSVPRQTFSPAAPEIIPVTAPTDIRLEPVPPLASERPAAPQPAPTKPRHETKS